jgi:O-antigen/teichoic acid export membrane protein
MLVAQSLGVVGLLGSNRDLISRSSLHDLGKVASEYRRFPLYTIWASLVDTIGAQAPLLLFTTFFELSVTGQFSLATRMLALPAAIIGQAVGDVFYPTIAKFKQDLPTSLAMIEELATQLLFVALVVFTPVTLFGPLLFRFVFGSRWEQAGVFAAYLAPWLIVSFVTSPLSPFSLVHQKLKENFLFSLIMTTLRIVVIGIGAFYHRADLAVVLFSAVGSIVYIIYGDWLLRLAGSSLLIWLRQSGPMLIIWMLMMGGLLAIQALLPLTIVIGLSIASLLLFGRYYIRHLIALTRLKSSAQALV